MSERGFPPSEPGFPTEPAPESLYRGRERQFQAPWEAQAFAMAVSLHERGAFTWKEWAATLAAVIAEVKARGEPDTGEDYYRHWLTALERIVAAKGLVAAPALEERRHEWEEAAHRTPHGQPIELGRP